jgi:glyoxylase-like metal-dependent hydrolase (beta-lactamase superfamily II)
MSGNVGGRLKWDVLTKPRECESLKAPGARDALKWVANNVTLLYGERNAVLIDALPCERQARDLVDWIDDHDRHLETIYLTRGDPDAFFGLRVLLDHFPDARAVASAGVVRAMRRAVKRDTGAEGRAALFPEIVSAGIATPDLPDDDGLSLEGHALRVINTGHTHSEHTTVLRVPSIGLIVAGNLIYDNTHLPLKKCDEISRRAWLDAIDAVEALQPSIVIVGKGPLEPDCSPRHIADTRGYLLNFERLVRETQTASELYEQMLALYPDRIDPGSLWSSVRQVKPTVELIEVEGLAIPPR